MWQWSDRCQCEEEGVLGLVGAWRGVASDEEVGLLEHVLVAVDLQQHHVHVLHQGHERAAGRGGAWLGGGTGTGGGGRAGRLWDEVGLAEARLGGG